MRFYCRRPVPETLKKKEQRNAKWAEQLKAAREERKKHVASQKIEWAKRGQAHHEAWLKNQATVIEKTREAKAQGSVYVPAEAKVFLVIRTKGINAVSPKERTILQLFRLRQIHNAVFVRRNKATENLLRKIEPYISYGYPSRSTISKLIYKRGFGKVNRQRIPLSSNFIIEDSLKKHNIVCIEDLINEIATCGPHFKEANNFLWPFKLNPTRGGQVDKRRAYLNNGLFGNREEFINEFAGRML